MQKILISLLLAAAIPALAQTPKTKSETVKAEYCPRPSEKQECHHPEFARYVYCFFRRPVSPNSAIFHSAEGHCSIQNQLY